MIMIHFKGISYSRSSWCHLKRLLCSASTSNSTIEIPPRIERGPTDILHALESTVSRDPLSTPYKFHDDPFLLPLAQHQSTWYALSYESGKRTAMWVHKEHSDLFPKDLSDPPIEKFQPPVVYTDKSQVSEKMLSQAITKSNVSDALNFYKLLGDDISDETKLALFELLCFYNANENSLTTFTHERWFCKPDMKHWSHSPEIKKLYKNLRSKGPAMKAAACNAMICGLARCNQLDAAWLLFEKCKEENIPFNVNTYNYLIRAISKCTSNKTDNKKLLFDIFAFMNKEGIRPNVRTLNAALRVATLAEEVTIVKDLVLHLQKEFQKLDIKFSLGSYYYILNTLSHEGSHSYQNFMATLATVATEKFTMQDPDDAQFFPRLMDIAFRSCNKEAGNIIHNMLLSGNNLQFITNATDENSYYFAYLSLQLVTSTTEEFFEVYRQIIPSVYVPNSQIMKEIIFNLWSRPIDDRIQYIPTLWADVVTFGLSGSSVVLHLLNMVKEITLPDNSPTAALFADIAWHTWEEFIQKERKKPGNVPFHSTTLGTIAQLLLRDGRVKEMREVLTEMVKHPDSFLTNMLNNQAEELFKSSVSKNCFAEAILILEYCANAGLKDVVKLAKTLHTKPELDDVSRNKLNELIEMESIQTTKSWSN